MHNNSSCLDGGALCSVQDFQRGANFSQHVALVEFFCALCKMDIDKGLLLVLHVFKRTRSMAYTWVSLPVSYALYQRFAHSQALCILPFVKLALITCSSCI